jgi:hypothetical protein
MLTGQSQMKYPLYLSIDDVKKLEFEVVSTELKIRLTRMLERWIANRSNDDSDGRLFWQNKIINKSRSISGGPIYVLEPDGYGMYLPEEYAYHDAEMALVFRRLQTPQFVEFSCELIDEGFFEKQEINELLEQDGVSFRFFWDEGEQCVSVDVFELVQIEDSEPEHYHL